MEILSWELNVIYNNTKTKVMSSRTSDVFKEYATVDERPTEDGYFTNPVDPRASRHVRKEGKIYFSIREEDADSSAQSDTSDITVSLQFRCEGDTGWQDFKPLDGSEFATGNRVIIEDSGAGVWWRAGVYDYDYTGGNITFGFDW